jgi:uroporphyrinogen decarboxylase
MKKLLNTLQGQTQATPALWLMRQAGRYLPEYRAVRAQAGGFLDLCFQPELAAEVTLQPIQRFDFDAAIIFADILLIPHALGRNLRFVEQEGPKLEPLQHSSAILDKTLGMQLEPVYAALRLVRKNLPAHKTLIGFCGAPFTVACYMISGGGSKDFSAVLAYAQRDRTDFLALLALLVRHSVEYLCGQIAAGAEIIQIFESWAGLVRTEGWLEADWHDCIVVPNQQIIAGVRAIYPTIPMIVFPRGAGALYQGFAAATGATALSLDQQISPANAAQLQRETIIQGNLDPALLVQGGSAQTAAVQTLLNHMRHAPYIFNLGHGITPDTPIAHVHALVRQVRAE